MNEDVIEAVANRARLLPYVQVSRVAYLNLVQLRAGFVPDNVRDI
jgi:hypothetical protein